MTRCGIVAIIGAPNAGKSTLLNRLVGERLAIVSPRPQSTRLPVVGVRTEGDTQAILVDTPGILEPGYALHHAMAAALAESLTGADVILHLVEGGEPYNTAAIPALVERVPLRGLARRLITVVNKSDRGQAAGAPANALLISARNGEGIEQLWSAVRERLPEGQFRHAPDDLSTQSLRFFVCEILREVAFDQLKEELPYALHCEVEEFREDADPVYIRVTLFVERESQKGIVVGKGGRQLRALGETARKRVETLVGGRVYLDLWVKVLKDWRRNPIILRRLGFQLPETTDD